jgi:hypothetical protein
VLSFSKKNGIKTIFMETVTESVGCATKACTKIQTRNSVLVARADSSGLFLQKTQPILFHQMCDWQQKKSARQRFRLVIMSFSGAECVVIFREFQRMGLVRYANQGSTNVHH